MANFESDFKVDDLDSVINVIGLKSRDPLKSFGGLFKATLGQLHVFIEFSITPPTKK